MTAFGYVQDSLASGSALLSPEATPDSHGDSTGSESSSVASYIVSQAATPDFDTDDTHSVRRLVSSASPFVSQAATPDFDTDDTHSVRSRVSSTASLCPSILAYEEEHGRTFHATTRTTPMLWYPLPNDQKEQRRLILNDYAIRLTLNRKLFFAPLESPHEILDVGAGTGSWCINVGDTYPGSNILGVDISPIQPTLVPPNVSFVMEDAEDTWQYHNDLFSLIHTQNMHGFSLRDWPGFYEKAFAKLVPGGWVENHEFDLFPRYDGNTVPEVSLFMQWSTYFESGLRKAGMTSRCYSEIVERQMKSAGFTNTTVRAFDVPIGLWPEDQTLRDAGKIHLRAILDGLYGLSARIFIGVLGWNPETLEVFLAYVRSELQRTDIACYWRLYVFLGQKPQRA